jgi:hypothetical protein
VPWKRYPDPSDLLPIPLALLIFAQNQRLLSGHSLSQWPDSTRDRLPDPWQCGGSTPSGDCNARRAEPPNGKSDRLDQGQLCEAAPGGRSRGNRWHGRIHAAPSFPGADRHESCSVSETVSVAGSAGTHAHGWSGRRQCGLRGGIRKRQPIQPRIQPSLRPTTDAGYSRPSLAERAGAGVGRQSVNRRCRIPGIVATSGLVSDQTDNRFTISSLRSQSHCQTHGTMSY